MQNLKESVESFAKKTYTKVKRNERSYRDTYTFIGAEIQRYREMYKNCIEEDQIARLIRDMLDILIRRYHDYSIRGDIGAHYRQQNILKGETVFEHVIPASEIRDMLIEEKSTKCADLFDQ
jgi:hypothetical protein